MPIPPERALLEEEQKRLLRLVGEAASTVGYHDLRRKGLVGTLEVYEALLAQVQAKLAALTPEP